MIKMKFSIRENVLRSVLLEHTKMKKFAREVAPHRHIFLGDFVLLIVQQVFSTRMLVYKIARVFLIVMNCEILYI